FAPMRATGARSISLVAILAATLTFLATSVTAPAGVLAVSGADITNLAKTTYGMTCNPSGSNEVCTRDIRYAFWTVTISPASGPLKSVVTEVIARIKGSDVQSEPWMTDIHGTACDGHPAAGAFASALWAMANPGSLGPSQVATCTTSGKVFVDPLNGGPPL